ncbi:MAG: TnsD family transposase [Syntrophomonas sp.]
MLTFFPHRYSDELFYSVLARYHSKIGYLHPRDTLNELFGKTTNCAVCDLPSCFNLLTEHIPEEWGYDENQLIYITTLYNYYAPFMDLTRANRLLETMKGNFGGSIHTFTGIMASSIKTPRFFKFCPVCVEEELEKLGECYWHRLHQSPGVLICPEHKQLLLDSTVLTVGMHKHEFIPALKENCQFKPYKVDASDDTMGKLLKFAIEAQWLLDNTVSSPTNLNWYRERYVNLLIQKDLATPSGRVRVDDLIYEFLSFYGEEFLKLMQSLPQGDNNWLASIARKHRKVFHPIRHLLMMGFLTGSIAEFMNNAYTYEPFGKGPWPCLNAAAGHYKKPVITDLEITYCTETRKPVGTFTCKCGFVFSRRGPDKDSNDRYRIGRVKEFGPVWKESLQKLLSMQDMSFRAIARKLEVDTNTVIKYSHLPEDEQSNKTNTDIPGAPNTMEEYRKAWSQLITAYPSYSKTELRKIKPGLYIWLYRHDREWLNENSPFHVSPVLPDNRVDWQKRDEEVLNKVKKVVQVELRSSSKPRRITISRLGKETGLLALLERHLDKLPKTKSYLDATTEELDGFRIRRIKWASKVLDDSEEEVKPWKIAKLAGLRPEYYDLIDTTLNGPINYEAFPNGEFIQ